jgi:3-carboxy-cis,cis-muconate cycloisomerase
LCGIATLRELDFAKLEAETARIGYPVLPVVEQIVALCRDGLGEWCHWGATTQDVTDTATVLQIREALTLIEADLDRISATLAGLARKYRDTPMAGRSNLQQAVPITFGYKMAALLAGFERHRQRLAQLKERVLVGEFGGAAGTLASLGDRGLEVQAESDEGIAARRARDRVAHHARYHRRGRLLPRPGRRHLRANSRST